MIPTHARPKKNPTIGIRQFDDATFLLDASHAQLHELNPTGTLIWSLCDGSHDLQSIAEALSQEFEITSQEALQDLRIFVETLQKKELLSFEEE